MVWGCFVKNRLGPLVILDGKVTGQVYRNLLQDHLLPFFDSLNDEIPYLFQDDNAPVHWAATTMRWKDENMISCLPWPAQSPDLNPIEHVWDYLERKVRARQRKPKNRDELVTALQEEWNKIDTQYLENLVQSMPRRVKAVIENHGYPSKY